jgi:uncharacterized protein (DUF1015 family)
MIALCLCCFDDALDSNGCHFFQLQSKCLPKLIRAPNFMLEAVLMARIFPFRGLRYNPAKVKLAEVVTQPYDKITPQMQGQYYAASPYNLVRIILGKAQERDNESESVYTRAAAWEEQWIADGVLVPDAGPSLYLYTQTFRLPGDSAGAVFERRGLVALGQVEDYDQQVVFRHEQTLSKPKADRLNLLRATRTHFGQIFMLYTDPAAEIDATLRLATTNVQPTVEVQDEYDVLHRMWQIWEPEVVHKVQRMMADKKLIIADGHHRYETALNYRNERRRQAGDDLDAPYERVMMTFVNMDAPGLIILPTHRVVFGLDGFSIFEMVAKLQVNFEVEDLGPLSDIAAALGTLREAGKEGTALLAATAHGGFLLRSGPQVHWNGAASLSERQRALDVVKLHKLVLEGALGLSEDDIRDQKHLRYVRDARESVEQVQQGANVAFLMNPVRMEQVRDVAFGGEVLPQKSTDFYPKLLSGLVAYSLEGAAKSSDVGGHQVVAV